MVAFTTEVEIELESHLKGVLIVVIFITGFFGVIFPLRFAADKLVLSQASCAAGGVILSVAFCHLLPDSAETLSTYSDFPLANLLCCVGLLFVMFFEKVMVGPHEAIIGKLGVHTSPTKSNGDCHGVQGVGEHKHEVCSPLESPIGSPTEAWEESLSSSLKGCRVAQHHHHVAYNSRSFREGLESGLTFAKRHLPGYSDKDEDPCDISYKERETGFWIALVLLCVLSFHSIVEGIALGTARREGSIAAMAVAILSHKFLAASSLGVAFVKSGVPAGTIITYAIIFSFMTPSGAVLGVIISNFLEMSSVDLVAAVCQAFGSGTFLYISLMELLPEEMVGAKIKSKFFACVLGFTGMSLIAIYV
eukprot:TRINITY_DN464_c2_g1_i1.p1 TRINITY_DN464_c2_g1~~TRINITY_DN464_c2_g1_i1.p1  ORF type:complete len:362 (+),score=42.09 TRINITY_DN464_c2_g1_i1:85-1170(+)